MTIMVMMRKMILIKMILVVVMTVNWYQLFEIRGVCLIAKGDGGWVLGKER